MKMTAIAPIMLLVLGGGIFGAGKMGIVKIPGVSPPKKVQPGEATKEAKPETKPKPAVKPKPAKAPPVVEAAPREPAVPEEKKVAQIWNEIPTDKLQLVAAEYKDTELAKVLVHMDGEKAAEVLGALEPKRAAQVSRLVGRESVR